MASTSSSHTRMAGIAFCLSGLLFVPLVAGCGGTAKQADPARALPFSVRLKEVDVTEAAELFDTDSTALRIELAKALSDAGIFTRVFPDTKEYADTPADLDLKIEIRGEDFGKGSPTTTGAVFSTVTWLLAGHLSWFIDNRVYPTSDVTMAVSARTAEEGVAEDAEPLAGDVFRDMLAVQNLSLSFIERADTKDWFFNILMPPWLGDGDEKAREESLAERTIEFFAENEPERVLMLFPWRYFESTSRYLVYAPDTGELLILSQEPVESISIGVEGREPRVLSDRSEVARLRKEGAEEIEVERLIAERAPTVITSSSYTSRYYRIPLEPDEVGYVHVEVLPVPQGKPPSRWTILRGETQPSSSDLSSESIAAADTTVGDSE